MNLEQQIKELVSKQLSVPLNKVQNQSTLMGDLDGDSLDTVELILAIEDEFNIEVQENDAEKISTVQDLIDYLNSKIN